MRVATRISGRVATGMHLFEFSGFQMRPATRQVGRVATHCPMYSVSRHVPFGVSRHKPVLGCFRVFDLFEVPEHLGDDRDCVRDVVL